MKIETSREALLGGLNTVSGAVFIRKCRADLAKCSF